jgi:hypothetical protein
MGNVFEMIIAIVCIIYLYVGVIFLHIIGYVQSLVSIMDDSQDRGITMFEGFTFIFLWPGVIIWSLWKKIKTRHQIIK